MAIYRLLQFSPLGPEEIARLEAAYEQTLKTLHLKDRNDLITELIAKKIIEIGQTGVKDAGLISEQTLAALGISAPKP